MIRWPRLRVRNHTAIRHGRADLNWIIGHYFYGVSVLLGDTGSLGFGWHSDWPRWRIWLAQHGVTAYREDMDAEEF